MPMSAPAMAEKPLLVIKGIPETLHVPDLRVFFEPAVEQGLFSCFHFRRTKAGSSKPGELTCRVRAENKAAAEEIIRCFHNVPWQEVLIDAPVSNKARCVVEAAASGARTADAWELHPPPALPQGNVGTCRSAVLCAIRSCRLPASVIKRLGIVPSKIRSTRSSATIPPPWCWREPESELGEDGSGTEPCTEGATSSQPFRAKAHGERPLPASAIFSSLKKRSRPQVKAGAEAPEKKTKSQKLGVAKAATVLKPHKMCAAMSDDEGSDGSQGIKGRDPGLEGRHVPRPLDTDPDDFDEPLEKAPHYERSDRLDSAAGYLYEDTVEHIWDKQDASGLVWYTDAAFWDRMAGGLDERCADAWDVESEGSGDAASSAGSSPRNRPTAMEQGTGLAAARQGVAGRIMRSWGGCPSAAPSSTLLAVVEGLQPNLARTGLGWVGDQRSRPKSSRPQTESDWNRIGSIYDPPQEEMKQRSFSVRPSIPASFSAASLYFAEDRRRNIAFVPATGKT